MKFEKSNQFKIATMFFVIMIGRVVGAVVAPHNTSLTIYKNAAVMEQKYQVAMKKGHIHHVVGPLVHTLLENTLAVNFTNVENYKILETFLHPSQTNDHFNLNIVCDAQQDAAQKDLFLSYVFEKLTWQMNYVIHFSSGYKTLKFNGWIDINNNTSQTLPKAKLQFVDSDLPPLEASNQVQMKKRPKSYPYEHMTELVKGTKKRIQLVTTEYIKVKQDYRVLVGGQYLEDMNGKTLYPFIETWVTFQNTKENGLGRNIPAGQAVLYYHNSAEQLDLLGTAPISHIPEGEEISVRIPSLQSKMSFEKESKFIEVELNQNKFSRADDTQITETHYTLDLKNKTTEEVNVKVMLDMPANSSLFEIVRESGGTKIQTSDAVYWEMKVPSKKTVQLKYHLRYMKN